MPSSHRRQRQPESIYAGTGSTPGPGAPQPSRGSPGSRSLQVAPKPTRKINRGLTCSNCRARKTRCDGGQPGCKTCEVYRDECRYDRAPPMSQILALSRRLQEAEATIQELQMSQRSSRGGQSPSPRSVSPTGSIITWRAADGQHRDDTAFDGPMINELTVRDHPMPDPSEWPLPDLLLGSASHESSRALSFGSPIQPATALMTEGQTSDLSVDANGQLCYYGPTSNMHEPPKESSTSPQNELPSSKIDVRNHLTLNAKESRSWEEFALGNAALRCDVPRETMNKLMAVHWTWIAPCFNWVYRPAFMRDMTTGGQYFSDFLLTTMCAHSARYEQQAAIGEILVSRSRLLLGTEIHKPSSIPTVQALLQLSARDLAYGRISQAWLYSGMAFRMVSDLGLHHSNGKVSALGHLNSEDLEIRRRLFWSCYFWDKAISLYLGRMPVLLELPLDNVPELLDDSVENETWTPFAGVDVNLSNLTVGSYPPYKSHAITCFTNSCKLAVILNDIIQGLYSRKPNVDLNGTLVSISTSLDQFRRHSPSHLVLDPDNLPVHSPPPHILTQNLLYFTTVILLHRPFQRSGSHRDACRTAAIQIEKLLRLLEATFGFGRITYLMAYCIYMAASIFVNDIKSNNAESCGRMDTLLRALTRGSSTSPILQRGIDIIINSLGPHLDAVPGRWSSRGRAPVQVDRPVTTTVPSQMGDISSIDRGSGFPWQPSGSTIANIPWAMTPGTSLPAFLFPDLGLDVNGDPTAGGSGVDTFSLLNAFPEQRIEGDQGEWFMLS